MVSNNSWTRTLLAGAIFVTSVTGTCVRPSPWTPLQGLDLSPLGHGFSSDTDLTRLSALQTERLWQVAQSRAYGAPVAVVATIVSVERYQCDPMLYVDCPVESEEEDEEDEVSIPILTEYEDDSDRNREDDPPLGHKPEEYEKSFWNGTAHEYEYEYEYEPAPLWSNGEYEYEHPGESIWGGPVLTDSPNEDDSTTTTTNDDTPIQNQALFPVKSIQVRIEGKYCGCGAELAAGRIIEIEEINDFVGEQCFNPILRNAEVGATALLYLCSEPENQQQVFGLRQSRSTDEPTKAVLSREAQSRILSSATPPETLPGCPNLSTGVDYCVRPYGTALEESCKTLAVTVIEAINSGQVTRAPSTVGALDVAEPTIAPTQSPTRSPSYFASQWTAHLIFPNAVYTDVHESRGFKLLVQRMLADALSLSVSYVQILSVRAGSVIVEFAIIDGSEYNVAVVNAKIAEYMSQDRQMSTFSAYQIDSTDVHVELNAIRSKPVEVNEPEGFEWTKDIIIVVATAGGVVVVVSMLLCYNFGCMRRKKNSTGKPRRSSSASQAVDEDGDRANHEDQMVVGEQVSNEAVDRESAANPNAAVPVQMTSV